MKIREFLYKGSFRQTEDLGGSSANGRNCSVSRETRAELRQDFASEKKILMSLGYSEPPKIIDAATSAATAAPLCSVAPLSPAAERARAAYEAATTRPRLPDPPPGIFPDTPPFVPAKEIDPDRIAELEKLTPEIHLVSPDLGDVFLVARHTGNSDRYELTYSEAATLRLMVDSFPGARVVGLRPCKAPGAAPAAPPPAPAAPPSDDWDAP